MQGTTRGTTQRSGRRAHSAFRRSMTPPRVLDQLDGVCRHRHRSRSRSGRPNGEQLTMLEGESADGQRTGGSSMRPRRLEA